MLGPLAEQVPFDCQAAMDFVVGRLTLLPLAVWPHFGACRHGGVVSMTRLTKSHPGFAAL